MADESHQLVMKYPCFSMIYPLRDTAIVNSAFVKPDARLCQVSTISSLSSICRWKLCVF